MSGEYTSETAGEQVFGHEPERPSGGRKTWTAVIIALSLILLMGLGLLIRGALLGTAGPGVPGAGTGKGTKAKAGTVEAVLESAETYLKQGEMPKAESVLIAAIAQWPEDQRLYVAYGELLVSDRRLEEAYDQYVKALAAGPRNAEVEFTAGTVANMAGKTDRAVEHYSAAQASNPKDYRIPLFLAQMQIKQSDLEGAKKNLLIAGNLSPETAVTWGTLAEIALRENKLEIATGHAAKARELDPENISWRLIEARIKKRQNKPEAALSVLLGLSDAERREPGVLPLMAECYGMLSRPADAADLYAKASESDPANGDLALEAGLWLEKAGKKDAAKRYAGRAKMLGKEGAAELMERLSK